MRNSTGGRRSRRRGSLAPLAAFVSAALALSSLLFSCGKMLSGTDITDEITADVIEADAEKVTIVIQAMKGGKLSLNGPQVKKVSVPFSLTASAEDAYAFSGWTVAGSGQVTFVSTAETTAQFTIVKPAADITITGNFVGRPKVSATSVEPSSLIKTSAMTPIVFTFSKGMNVADFTAANISITGKAYGIGDADILPFFSYYTLASTSTTLTLTPTVGFPADWGYAVTILLSKNLRSAGGISMEDDYQFIYYTDNT